MELVDIIATLEKLQTAIDSQKNKNLPSDDEFDTLEQAYQFVQSAIGELESVVESRG